ncbi:MAG: aspartate-semialdehyde dehydrogenase [Alphaproteobacteria bacterium]|jgi:aspartate-semialdehyde dehydrogenase|nr:aspartate-semialdehyde dehydrogenase [Alphaproteobacteria bacterium]
MYKVAVVGVGRVASEILDILDAREFPIKEIIILGEGEDIGKRISYGEDLTLTIKDIHKYNFEDTDFAFFCAGGEIAKKYAEKIAVEGTIVIDCSTTFRADPQVPLVIPEVNIQELYEYRTKGIIASPNCTTVMLLLALAPLHREFEVKRVVISTYQSVSGAGSEALDELFEQTRGIYVNQPFLETKKVFTKQIAFNAIPHIAEFGEDGYTAEEKHIINETHKILDSRINLTATCVRVPIFIGHALSVNIEFNSHVSKEEIKRILEQEESLGIVDFNADEGYVSPVESAGEDKVFISRIRLDETVENGANLWIVGDNLRKGAALNMVQIAEEIIKIM